jgi:hypothetical protein
MLQQEAKLLVSVTMATPLLFPVPTVPLQASQQPLFAPLLLRLPSPSFLEFPVLETAKERGRAD